VNTAEVKLRTAAAANVPLQGYLGTAPFRWFDTQLPQNQMPSGTCVRVQRVSTVRPYSFAGIQNVSWPRFQIDVLDPDPELGRTVAKAIIQFFKTAAFGNISGQAANFVLNQREGMDFQLQPPVFVHSIDVRIFNLEE
jgi:hypothetical protein